MASLLRTTIEKIPDHLLSNIFIRLPAKVVAQMRSVSKPWNALLSQLSFIKSHLHRSIHNNDENFVVVFDESTFTFTAHPSKSPHVKLPNFIQLPVADPSDRYLRHELLDSVNGLLLLFSYHLRDFDCSLQIWNPSLSALLEIPDAGEKLLDNFLFGFDPNTDDYKVVRFSYVGEEPEVFMLVHVFSMRKGSWELTKERFPSQLVLFGEEVCGDGHDGHLHWLCYADKEMKLQTIVAFDLGVESFSEMRLPLPVLRNMDCRKNVLGILAGKVCLMSCVKDDVCEVWVMNEYGDVTSWAKHHLFSQFSCDITPLGFTLNDEFLFAFNNVLAMYDPVTSKLSQEKMASPHQHPTKIENLPGELLSEILIRVPAKPLARMRCVSKPWNALLSKPSFIKSHLHCWMHANDEIYLVLANGGLCVPFSITAHLSRSPRLELTNFFKLPLTISPSESQTVRFLGSVNGLICFCYQSDYDHFADHITSYSDLVIQIWNPSLSTVLTLPPCQLLPNRFSDCTNVYFWFGYDPKTDDYKLFKLISRFEECLQVEVYSLRKDSWGLINQRFPSHVTQILDVNKICVDGCDGRLHWLGSIGNERKLVTMVAFDLGMETFSEISLPQSFIDHNERRCTLGVIAAKLCLLSCTKNFKCEVWVMNEYGVAESWVKHNVLSDLTGVYFPYGFTISNKFLYTTFEDDGVHLYDLISADTKIMGTGGIQRVMPIKIVQYVESLVWMAPIRSS
ncbi:hypothetical protein OSB04_017971 [Centaurea solstitialis]|uniref:F-box domain-containing protein n=1 Tax=Centaurea solstitialis TaxID=347529 RepID=A0AA38WMI5_9ASTR|nr:hypothetical protein OSB04_017971 [Centaurea solstitialis]